MKVYNIKNNQGRAVVNQFIIINDEAGKVYFQSYDSIIAVRSGVGSSQVITLDRDSWDYSQTTGKYRNIFLGETKKETEKKIKSGIYKLANLN